MRSPLIIRVPGGQSGKTVNAVVGNVDLYPTLLELTGVEKPEDVQFHGKSLVPLLNHPEAPWDNITYTCAKGRYGLITDKYRFTISDGGASLYDLHQDPHEWKNLAGHPEYVDLITQFEAKLAKVAWNEANQTRSPRDDISDIRSPAAPGKTKGPKKWDWFATLDMDKNEAVTAEEWLKWSQTKAKRKNESYDRPRQKSFFAKRDIDSNQVITCDELEATTKK